MRISNQTDVPVFFTDAVKKMPVWLPVAAATTGIIMASSFGVVSGTTTQPLIANVRPLLHNSIATGGTMAPAGIDVLRKLTSTPGTVADLRLLSGLTADQIARLFGVSRRSVQNWIAGATMADQHQYRLQSLLTRIRPLGLTPEDRRRQLLRSSGGRSEFHRMAADAPRGAVIQTTALSARDQLGA